MGVAAEDMVEKVVIDIVEDLTRDWGLDLSDGVGKETSIVEDLEFASVDIIQLCVAIEQHYDRKLGFQDLLMKEGNYVTDLSVGDISEFVIAKLKDETS
jgi:acyl carrier protein